MSEKKNSMKIDKSYKSNGVTSGIEVYGLDLYPVSANASGEGLPYAPVDWPNPGDIWRWKAGRRTGTSGYYLHRYLYTPKSFDNDENKRRTFASKLSVEHYIRKEFPGTNVNRVFASFSWNIPSINIPSPRERSPEEIADHLDSISLPNNKGCKLGNKTCNSFTTNGEAMPCDLCCSEPGFCRDCRCILCGKNISSAYGCYSYIKCEAKDSEGHMCSHLAHVECALRTHLAGTVGGNIGLDAEYYCRRCDARTDLVRHVKGLVQACKSIDSRDAIEKILKVGICILLNSERGKAKQLLDRIELAISKLSSEACVEDIWKLENDMVDISPGASNGCSDTFEVTGDIATLQLNPDSRQTKASPYTVSQTLKLEDDIEDTLQSLRKSQEAEYRTAEEFLNAQKDHILNLYKQLHEERSELVSHSSSTAPDSLLESVLNRLNEIKGGLHKLRIMEGVGKGFGRNSKGMLKEHFGVDIDS